MISNENWCRLIDSFSKDFPIGARVQVNTYWDRTWTDAVVTENNDNEVITEIQLNGIRIKHLKHELDFWEYIRLP